MAIRSAKDFEKSNNNAILDAFIENEIYSQFDEGESSAIIYINLIEQENIILSQLKNRLKELGFKTEVSKEGIDQVLNINIK